MQNRKEVKNSESHTESIKVLVCLSASPSNQRVIKSAAKFAGDRKNSVTALYIDDGKTAPADIQLRKNIDLAATMGADVQIVSAKDVLRAVMEYAQITGVTDLFIGYSGPSRKWRLRHLPAYRLVHELPDVDVHIIPDASVQLTPSVLNTADRHRLNIRDFVKMSLVMAAATVLSVLFDKSRFSNGNIITIYILAVLITSVITAERIYGVIAAVLYILLFNFLFIDPRFSFLVYDPYYMVTYLVSIIAAVITGNISSKMKHSTTLARINAYQAQVLLNASEQLQKAQSSDEIIRITSEQLNELLGRTIIFCPVREDRLCTENAIFKGRQSLENWPGKEEDALEWAFRNNQRSGNGTRHFPEAGYQYLTVRIPDAIFGVVGVAGDKGELNSYEENILLSLISECAMSLEGEKNRKEREAAQIIAENERFRSKLLRSVSHDLRTPLTSISGNAANLATHGDEFDDEEKERMYTDIYADSTWLIDLVENLLAITRLEESVEIHKTGELVADVLETAVEQARRHESLHPIILTADEDCLIALMDVSLILQVISNLISNAVKYTPDGTNIYVKDWKKDDCVVISVADDGPGIPDEDKPYVFDLFYTGKKASDDSSRSLGLGLNLCRSILDAHGGTIRVEDNKPHGTVFTFTLKLWEGMTNEALPDSGR